MPEIILGHFADQRGLSIFNLLCKASSLFENLIGKSILLTHKKQYCGNTFGCIRKKKYDNEQKICKNHYTTKMFMKYVLCNICGVFDSQVGGNFLFRLMIWFYHESFGREGNLKYLYIVLNFLFSLNCN